MAYDPQYGGTILFGGFDAVSAAALSDTWLFANDTWTDLTATRGWTAGPIGVWWQFLAYDPAGPYLLMFGGRNNSLTNYVTNATWELNTTGWHQLSTPVAPSPRAYGALFYDPANQKMVLFGGACLYCASLNDTWFFANGTWTNVTSVLTGPAPNSVIVENFGWDTALGAGVVQGGEYVGGSNPKSNQTWLFRTGWNQSNTTGPAPAIGNGGGVYDAAAKMFLVVDGEDSSGTHWNWTYGLSGTNWVNLTSSVNLPRNAQSSRCCEAISYDPVLNQVVIFGGNNYTGVTARQNDTWTLTLGGLQGGISISPPDGPAPLAVAFNSTISNGVPPYSFNWSFGDGSPNSTLENTTHVYASVGIYQVRFTAHDSAGNWTNLTAQVIGMINGGWVEPSSAVAPSPDQRGYMAMAFDPQRAGVLLYGGYNLSNGAAFGDTWLFSNGSWANLNGTGQLRVSPPPLWNADLTWDPSGPYMVLFGGRDPGAFYNETWIFNLTGWHRLTTPVAPSVREETQFFYDSANSQLVLFGGTGFNFGAGNFYGLDDTWFFSGGTWKNVTSVLQNTAPPETTAAAVAWDPAIGRAVMFGGASVGGACATYATTWTFGTGWNDSNLTYGPGPEEAGSTAAYDPQLDAVLFYGADLQGTCGLRGGTWEFANDTWKNITQEITSPASVPPYRYSSRVAWDSVEKVAVLFGGAGVSGFYYPYSSYTMLNDTWTFPFAPLTAQIQAAPTIGYVPLNVSLTAAVAGGEGPYQVNWSFGPGLPNQTTLTASHTYNATGTFVIGFQATDSQGRSINRSVEIEVAGPLSASANASTVAGDAPLRVNFTAPIAGGAAPFTYSWNFGDGGTSTLAAPSHRYAMAGNFTAQVVVKDVLGQSATSSVGIQVSPTLGVSFGKVNARAIAPYMATLPAIVVGGKGPYSYDWEFGDGGSGAGNATPVHTYVLAGTYVVNVTVRDLYGSTARASFTIQVAAPVTPHVVPSATSGQNPFTLSVSASAVGGFPGYTFTWNFGDSSPLQSGSDVSHTYSSPGTYQINVTANDTAGNNGVATLVVRDVAALTASVTSSVAAADAPANITFFSAPSGGAAPYTYVWNFGDGSGGNSASPSHRFTGPGRFNVGVTVTDSLGYTTQAFRAVQIYPTLRVGIDANQTQFQLGGSVTISAPVTGGAGGVGFVWTGLPVGCGAGNVSSFTCVPSAGGRYNVTVNVTDSVRGFAVNSLALNVTNASCACGPRPAGGGGGLSTLDLLLIVAGVVAVIAVAVLIAVRRRRPPATVLDGSSSLAPGPETDTPNVNPETGQAPE